MGIIFIASIIGINNSYMEHIFRNTTFYSCFRQYAIIWILCGTSLEPRPSPWFRTWRYYELCCSTSLSMTVSRSLTFWNLWEPQRRPLVRIQVGDKNTDITGADLNKVLDFVEESDVGSAIFNYVVYWDFKLRFMFIAQGCRFYW